MDITIILIIWVITSGVVSTFFSDREIGSGSVFLLSLFLSPIIGILIGLSSKRIDEVPSTTPSSSGKSNSKQNRKNQIISRLEEIKRMEGVDLGTEELSKEKEELKKEFKELEKPVLINNNEVLESNISPESIYTIQQLTDYIVQFIDEIVKGDNSFLQGIPPFKVLTPISSSTTSDGKFLVYLIFSETKTYDGKRSLEGIREIIEYGEDGIRKEVYRSKVTN